MICDCLLFNDFDSILFSYIGSVGYQSQLTMHTSISSSFSTLTSYSVYQIDEDQISLNKDRPLGEGNFGIVFKGVWTKSNGDWEGTPK